MFCIFGHTVFLAAKDAKTLDVETEVMPLTNPIRVTRGLNYRLPN